MLNQIFYHHQRMPRRVRRSKSTTASSRRRTYRRSSRYRRTYGYRALSRRISAVSRRVAGEVCKFESTPQTFSNNVLTVGTSLSAQQWPLTTITSGTPYIYPINWIYSNVNGQATGAQYVNGISRSTGEVLTVSFKNPLWYNTNGSSTDSLPSANPQDGSIYNDVSPGLQYRMKYIYINALFNASINSSTNNTDGALRIVIVKDKQPSGGSATWADPNNNENSRGVFNSNRIDAQLNPNTVGRFRIMYDKTLRFNTTNGYKPFKYFKKLATTVRNNRDLIPAVTYSGSTAIQNNGINNANNYVQTPDVAPPVLKNAYYLMMFPDGVSFTHTTEAETPAAAFHLFNRVAYYNN